MRLWLIVLFCGVLAVCEAGRADKDDDRGIYPSNNRHVQKLRTYNREMYKAEHCTSYQPRTNCTSILQQYPPTEEGRRYKVCFAKCTLAAVCDDRLCGDCAPGTFEYRQFPMADGLKTWCRPVPCAVKGYVKWTEYTCKRERSCTLLHCKLGVRKVKAKVLEPFSLQLLASRTVEDTDEVEAETDPEAQDLGIVELGYEVQLGSVNVGSPVHFRVKLTVPVVPEDVYLLADATGSLEEAISVVQANFSSLISTRQASVPTASFGLGFFRDESSRGEEGEVLVHGFSNVQSITDNTDLVQAGANRLLARAGGDTPEGGLLALYTLATDSSIGWRFGARKIVVMFGDAPQHEPVCVGNAQLTRHDVIRALRAKDIAVVAIQVGAPGMDAETTHYRCNGLGSRQKGGQMTDVTQGTRGFLTKPVEQAALVDAARSTIENLNIKFEIDASDCGPEYVVDLTGLLPDYVRYGDVLDIPMTVTAKRAACWSRRPKKCVLRYIVGGVTISLQDVSLDEVKGC